MRKLKFELGEINPFPEIPKKPVQELADLVNRAELDYMRLAIAKYSLQQDIDGYYACLREFSHDLTAELEELEEGIDVKNITTMDIMALVLLGDLKVAKRAVCMIECEKNRLMIMSVKWLILEENEKAKNSLEEYISRLSKREVSLLKYAEFFLAIANKEQAAFDQAILELDKAHSSLSKEWALFGSSYLTTIDVFGLGGANLAVLNGLSVNFSSWRIPAALVRKSFEKITIDQPVNFGNRLEIILDRLENVRIPLLEEKSDNRVPKAIRDPEAPYYNKLSSAYLNLGILYSIAKKDWEKARQLFRQASAISNDLILSIISGDLNHVKSMMKSLPDVKEGVGSASYQRFWYQSAREVLNNDSMNAEKWIDRFIRYSKRKPRRYDVLVPLCIESIHRNDLDGLEEKYTQLIKKWSKKKGDGLDCMFPYKAAFVFELAKLKGIELDHWQ